jgi:hypothetical protein
VNPWSASLNLQQCSWENFPSRAVQTSKKGLTASTIETTPDFCAVTSEFS